MSTGTLYERRERFVRLSNAAGETQVIADRPVRLLRVLTNTGIAASSLTIYNNNGASGDVVAVVATIANKQVMNYGIDLENGMTVVKSAHAVDLTIVYQ